MPPAGFKEKIAVPALGKGVGVADGLGVGDGVVTQLVSVQ